MYVCDMYMTRALCTNSACNLLDIGEVGLEPQHVALMCFDPVTQPCQNNPEMRLKWLKPAVGTIKQP